MEIEGRIQSIKNIIFTTFLQFIVMGILLIIFFYVPETARMNLKIRGILAIVLIVVDVVIVKWLLKDKYIYKELDEREGDVPCLIFEEGGFLKPFIIEKEEFKIGRQQELCDFVMPICSISKVHAKIELNKEGYYIQDLNSTNGTFVNGKKLNSEVKILLRDDDVISIANIKLKFKV